MTEKAVFQLAVRIIGVLVVLASLLYLVSALILFFNPYYQGAAPAVHYLMFGVLASLVGWYFLRGAPLLVRLAFGRDSDSDDTPKV